MTLDLSSRVVLVTGGTLGIGLATGLAYGRCGAHVVLTHRWGSADEDQVRGEFAATGAREPLICQADASNDEDTVALMQQIATRHDRVDVLVANVAFAKRVESLADWKKRDLFRSLEYTAWPMWAYTEEIHRRWGRWPAYVIGLSSDGPDHYFSNYDFVACSKAVLETMCRYLQYRLREHGTRVNVVRSRMVRTQSFDATFGVEFNDFIERMGFADCYTTPEELANVVLALGSGLLDAMGGQVITADKGFTFFDNLNGVAEREQPRDGAVPSEPKKQES
ncbi:MAG: SDR family oxidoreductase [Deltaproteobacteria bacterium]|nr:SDR family oxidoreductase [Deltaproteobacteria bacterium]